MTREAHFTQALHDMQLIMTLADQEFFIACGTLLGQHRDGCFIPGDDDIDIGIMYDKLQDDIDSQILQSGLFSKLEHMGCDKESLKMTYKHVNGTKIDIFVHYPISPGLYYYATHLQFDNGIPRPPTEHGDYLMWVNHIRGLQPVMFCNNTFLAPVNVEEYLQESYGPDWKIPISYSYQEGVEKKLFKNIKCSCTT